MSKSIVVLLSLVICLIQIVEAQVKDEQKIIQNLNKAEIVVVAEVLEIGKEPGFWSGYFATFQTVHYRIVEVIKGSLEENEISIRHPVVKNSRTADKSKPKLSSIIFAKGNRLILFIEKQNGKESDRRSNCNSNDGYQTFDENFGVLIADEDIVKIIRKNLKMVKN
jgi:hypothetical protein